MKRLKFKYTEPMKLVIDREMQLSTNLIGDAIAKMAVKIAKRKDELVFKEIMKWAKKNGYTEVLLIDEEFIKKAFDREIKRRRKWGSTKD